MPAKLYSNLPQQATGTIEPTVQAFDLYYTKPLELNSNVLAAIKGFFQSRGFDDVASESTAVILMRQASVDKINPMNILDTLRGIDNVAISALVSEILNFNRVKTSFLGYALNFTPDPYIARNIIP
jgi:hypothetical protein